MALKQLVLNKRLSELRAKLAPLDEEKAVLETRRAAMKLREAEIETAMNEINDESTEEERSVVEEQVASWETDDKQLTEEEESNKTERETIDAQVAEIEAELNELNEKAERAKNAPKPVERKVETHMNKRMKFFAGMETRAVEEMFSRSEVKDFVTRVRGLIAEKRAVNGAALLIPDVFLGMLRLKTEEYSKLMKRVNVRNVPGNGRMLVQGAIPEAVWTEMCAKLNELTIGFNQVEVDGYKVGGFIAVCNAILEDSDIDLAGEILDDIAHAIGRALDKAIIYGRGRAGKMPLGIVTRLTQTVQPSDYSANAPTWKDLHTTNVISISGKTKLSLFEAINEASGAISDEYGDDDFFWVMNRKTHTKLTTAAMGVNAAGAIVSGLSREMPIVGGAIEDLAFMPDNVIVGGYGNAYLLAERAGTQLASSDEVRFIEDQTVFKGTARYDGQPVIPESFIVIDIAGGTISANDVTFPADTANAG